MLIDLPRRHLLLGALACLVGCTWIPPADHDPELCRRLTRLQEREGWLLLHGGYREGVCSTRFSTPEGLSRVPFFQPGEDTTDPAERRVANGLGVYVFGLAFCPKVDLLATSDDLMSKEARVVVWYGRNHGRVIHQSRSTPRGLAWSRDGSRLAFYDVRIVPHPPGPVRRTTDTGNLYVYDRSDESVRVVVPDVTWTQHIWKRGIWPVCWSEDGRSIYYVSKDKRLTRIRLADGAKTTYRRAERVVAVFGDSVIYTDWDWDLYLGNIHGGPAKRLYATQFPPLRLAVLSPCRRFLLIFDKWGYRGCADSQVMEIKTGKRWYFNECYDPIDLQGGLRWVAGYRGSLPWTPGALPPAGKGSNLKAIR